MADTAAANTKIDTDSLIPDPATIRALEDGETNKTTDAAIAEGRKMMSDPSAPRYSSEDALKAALEV